MRPRKVRHIPVLCLDEANILTFWTMDEARQREPESFDAVLHQGHLHKQRCYTFCGLSHEMRIHDLVTDDIVHNANDPQAIDSPVSNTVPVRMNVRLDCQTELQQIETGLGVKFAVNNAWNAVTASTSFFLNHGSNPHNSVSSEVYCTVFVLEGAKSFEENEAIARARKCI